MYFNVRSGHWKTTRAVSPPQGSESWDEEPGLSVHQRCESWDKEPGLSVHHGEARAGIKNPGCQSTTGKRELG
ncbi:hypothetical protein HHUSO_G14298 [Huso huso]|uniref:Uncharacterized protein n=1 Tax=Huso huso TaxID=61971 RepID=A0ABR0ZDP3_HUSHU